MDEWSKNLLIKEICQIRAEHGRRKVKGLQRIKKQVLQNYFLQEISFVPGLVKASLPEVIREKAS